MKGKYLALAASMLLSLGAANASAQPRNYEQGKHPQHRHRMERAEGRADFERRAEFDGRHNNRKDFVVDKNCKACKLEVRNAKMAHRHAKKAHRLEQKARHERAVAHQYASKSGSNNRHHHHN